MDTKAILDHQFTVAAYALTWAIQLGYLAWLGLRWRAQKRNAARSARNPRLTWPLLPHAIGDFQFVCGLRTGDSLFSGIQRPADRSARRLPSC